MESPWFRIRTWAITTTAGFSTKKNRCGPWSAWSLPQDTRLLGILQSLARQVRLEALDTVAENLKLLDSAAAWVGDWGICSSCLKGCMCHLVPSCLIINEGGIWPMIVGWFLRSLGFGRCQEIHGFFPSHVGINLEHVTWKNSEMAGMGIEGILHRSPSIMEKKGFVTTPNKQHLIQVYGLSLLKARNSIDMFRTFSDGRNHTTDSRRFLTKWWSDRNSHGNSGFNQPGKPCFGRSPVCLSHPLARYEWMCVRKCVCIVLIDSCIFLKCYIHIHVHVYTSIIYTTV